MLENLGLVDIDHLKLLNSRFIHLEETGVLATYRKGESWPEIKI